jgi:aryl-alcohol dehydrogenase-like predicted oxidoreductase
MAKVSSHKFILGTVQMGLAYGINNAIGKISLNDSCKILEYAYNKGIKILDSAEAYGNAHNVIGAFHKSHPKKRFKIITKLPNQFSENINDKINSYLKVLKVDKLHALLFHSFSSYKKDVDNFKDLIHLKNIGKIQYIGVSVYTNKEIEEVLLNDDVDIIQLPFNLFDNANLRGNILHKAKAKGKIIHTRSALLQGLFFKNLNGDNKTVRSLKDELTQLSNISYKSNLSIAHLAINYCLQQKNIDNMLIGVDSIAQLKDNINALNHELEDSTIQAIDIIKVNDINLLNPSLWN